VSRELTGLPRWDMTTVFPSLESAEFVSAFDAAIAEIGEMVCLFDRHGVRRREASAVDAAFVPAYEEVTARMNALQERLRVLSAYLGSFTSTDARNDLARSRDSELNTQSVQLNKLYTRYAAWVGTTDAEALLAASAAAKEHAYNIQRAGYQAQHQMSEVEEALAAEMGPSGISGWAKLHGNLTALLTVTVAVNGEERRLPMSSVRALAGDPDRAVRKAAYEAEIAAWEANAVPLAAALNGVKGVQQVVRKRRSYADDVEPTLFANGIDQATLDAMQAACTEAFPDFRRYLAAKARALGLESLAWYDLNAPIGAATHLWQWDEAKEFIRTHFAGYSDRLRDFADRSFSEQWIDAEPRVGKRGGAFCMGVQPGESRIMLNYDGSFMGVSTLAHELGHAYHNLNLAERSPMERSTPSTLAETASIFCETLAFDAALEKASKEERMALLDTVLDRNLAVVVDIHSRFLFEQSVFAKRAARDLTVNEFNTLMLDAQRATYGDAIAPLHPYMWAVKGHYYGPTFYNYPYTFGLLFGLGLYARYCKDPDTFRADYDDFLSSTGLADAVTLANRFNIDIQSIDFWRSSLDVIRRQIADFEVLVA
jgi:oligoendopeptidase F